MVKDLQYFLDEEDKFCNEHMNYKEWFYDESIGEMSFYGINDPLYYLFNRVISEINKTIKKPLDQEISFGLSDAQRVLLRLLYCNHSYIFRDDNYNAGITTFVQNLFDTLDDVVKKAPQNKDTLLYRFCNDYDRSDMKVGDVITIPHNLTCTNFDWHQEKDNNSYFITPLKNGKTRAHNLFEIYEHGKEKQVDFLRNTKFRVNRIEKTEGTQFNKFYLEEVE